jgi:hypothetical protein
MATQEQEKAVKSIVRAAYPQIAGIETNPAVQMVLDFLEEGEMPEECFLTSLGMRGKERLGESGCLWATNKRLLFVAWISVFSKKPMMLAFPYSSIEGINDKSGSILGFGGERLFAQLPQKKYTFISSQKGHSSDFADFLKQKWLVKDKAMLTTQIEPKAEEPNLTDQLEKIAALREKGLLSEEEFKEAKRKILQG